MTGLPDQTSLRQSHSHRRRRRRLTGFVPLLLLLPLALLVGCGVSVQRGQAPARPPSPGELAARLQDSLSRQDAPDFLALFSGDDHGQVIGQLLFDNLNMVSASLGSTDGVTIVGGDESWGASDLTTTPDTSSSPVVSLWVETVLSATVTPMRDQLALALDSTGRISEVTSPGSMWASGTITATALAGSQGTMLLSQNLTATQHNLWSDALSVARTGLSRQSWKPFTDPAAAVTMVTIPHSYTLFKGMAGVTDDSHRDIGALTQQIPGTSLLRIVVNPLLAPTTVPQDATYLLAHEMVHVVTRSPDSAAPLWLVEGVAEAAAGEVVPTRLDDVLAQICVWENSVSDPRDLPADAEFAAGATTVRLAYARSRLAVRSWIAHDGWPTVLGKLADPVDLPTATIKVAYRQQLRACSAQ